jgi:predicted metal-binding protein
MPAGSQWVVVCELCQKSLFTTPRVDDAQAQVLREHLERDHRTQLVDDSYGAILKRFRFLPAPDTD